MVERRALAPVMRVRSLLPLSLIGSNPVPYHAALTFDEQVKQFCRANDLAFEMIVSERLGRFTKEVYDDHTT